MTEGYKEKILQVGPAEYVTLLCKQVVSVGSGIGKLCGVNTTLYETPEGDLKLYVMAWESDTPSARTLSGEAMRQRWVEGGLFSEEEARQKHPVLLERILEKKRINEDRARRPPI